MYALRTAPVFTEAILKNKQAVATHIIFVFNKRLRLKLWEKYAAVSTNKKKEFFILTGAYFRVDLRISNNSFLLVSGRTWPLPILSFEHNGSDKNSKKNGKKNGKENSKKNGEKNSKNKQNNKNNKSDIGVADSKKRKLKNLKNLKGLKDLEGLKNLEGNELKNLMAKKVKLKNSKNNVKK